MLSGLPNERPTPRGRWRWYAALALVLVVGAALRFPGVSWGFDFSTAPYSTAHPDEEVACLGALLRGVPEMKNNGIPTERGMMFQCLVLNLIFKPHDITAAARIGRTYSVIWGLLTIVLTALIARRVKGDTAGIFAAILLSTSAVNMITSFWARGQINNVALCLASMLVAMHIRTAAKERAVILQFVASVLAGGAISTRWSVAMIPMLLACAVARGPVFPKLVATASGGLLGFFGLTGFFWTPDMIATNLEMQKFNLVTLYRRFGSHVTAGAAVVCTIAGTGLATSVLAGWFGVDRARRLKNPPLEDLSWRILRSKLDSPGVIILLPTAITFVMLSFNKFFDARYTDLFAPPLAIAAGIKLAQLWHKTRRWRILVAVLVAYQGVYAAGMLARYVNDSRKGMNAAIDKVWQPRGTICTTPYVSDLPLYNGHRLGPGKQCWDADWVVVSDLHDATYTTSSGTFTTPFLGLPPSCREILYCDGEDHRAFFQKLRARDGWDLVHVSKAAAWTPEIKLHHLLMTPKWMFTGDIRLFHKRPPPSSKPESKPSSKPGSKPR